MKWVFAWWRIDKWFLKHTGFTRNPLSRLRSAGSFQVRGGKTPNLIHLLFLKTPNQNLERTNLKWYSKQLNVNIFNWIQKPPKLLAVSSYLDTEKKTTWQHSYFTSQRRILGWLGCIFFQHSWALKRHKLIAWGEDPKDLKEETFGCSTHLDLSENREHPQGEFFVRYNVYTTCICILYMKNEILGAKDEE